MDYKQAPMEAMTNKELVEQYDRLSKSSLGECLKAMKEDGINYQIDLQTGRTKHEIQKFDKFFFEFIWSRMPPESFAEQKTKGGKK